MEKTKDSHLAELVCEIESLRSVLLDDGGTVYPECADNAIKFLESVDKKTRSRIQMWHICAMNHGTVVIDIVRGPDVISVELGRTMMGFYTKFKDGVNQTVDGEPYETNMITGKLKQALNYLSR